MGTKRLISIGSVLVKTVQKLDTSIGGMVLNTYASCLLLSTATLYVGSSIFFNNCIHYCTCFYTLGSVSIAVLSLVRLFYLTNSGQNLTISMKKSLQTLNRVDMEHDNSGCHTQKERMLISKNMELLKTELKDQSDSPINPCSAFSLSSGTLLGTFANIITYLIVLIQFKAAEKKEQGCF